MAKLLIGQTSDGKQFTLDPSSLTKHAVVFGATGSGKTVLCESIMEEASSRGTPVLAIDPKGDIGCLAIRSENFSFRPFSDNEAKLLGKTPEDYSKELADQYRDGYTALARDDDELNRFVEKTDVRVFTPRSCNIRLEDAPVLLPDLRSGRIRNSQSQMAYQLSSWAAGTFRNKEIERGSGS